MIPITFNHDDSNNLKKGNVRGQDLSSVLSFAMSKQAGLLDVFGNDCSVTAVAQNTPTGYATLTFSKGYVCVFGRIIYIEENEQVQVALPTSSSSVTGTLGIRINLGETGGNEVTWFTKTTALITENILINQVNGIYEFALYNYTATNNSFTLGNKVAPTIQSLPDYMKSANFETQEITDNSKKIATTEFVNKVLANNMTKRFGGNRNITPQNLAGHLWSSYTIGNLRILYGFVNLSSGQEFTINYGNTLFSNINYMTKIVTSSVIRGSYIERNAIITDSSASSITIKNPASTEVYAHFIVIGDKEQNG